MIGSYIHFIAPLRPHPLLLPHPHPLVLPSPCLLLSILCHRILWEGALQGKELIRSRETQNVPQRGFTEVHIYAACRKSAPASSFHCTEGPWVSRGVSGNRPLITSFHSLRGTAVSPSRLVPACKPPNTLFPAASFPTLFDFLITQLTILLLRNCHIRNILQKTDGRNKLNWALSPGSEREKGRGYFSFLKSCSHTQTHKRTQYLELRTPEATYCI